MPQINTVKFKNKKSHNYHEGVALDRVAFGSSYEVF